MANTQAIATKQTAFGLPATSGLAFGASGTLSINMQRSTAETSFDNDEVMLNIEKTTGSLCRITKQQLQSSINTDTIYLLGENLSFDTSTTPHTINLDIDLTSVNSIKSISTSDLILGAGSSAQTGDKIIFETNDVQRGYINDIDLDLSVNVNITNDKHYQIDGDDLLYNVSTSIHKNIYLNARIIQNISSTTSDGLFINYLNNSNNNSNAHLQFYSGGTSTMRMFIENDGKICINTVNPSEKPKLLSSNCILARLKL